MNQIAGTVSFRDMVMGKVTKNEDVYIIQVAVCGLKLEIAK